MFSTVVEHIKALEIELNIRVLYAVESGSRAWGFASSDSDWNVRFIYVHSHDWYLSVEDLKGNIELMLPNDIDLAGWELRKALRLFKKSNPPLLEWLRSPIVYYQQTKFVEVLRNATTTYFNPKSCLYHYYHMAKGNWESYFRGSEARIKKYFYVLRPLMTCSWIEKTNTMAPMEFEEVFAGEKMNDEARIAIENLLEQKRKGDELGVAERIPVIDSFIEKSFTRFTELLNSYNFKNQPDSSELNKIFRNSLEEAWN